MSESDGTKPNRLAELVRLQHQRARAGGRDPGEMAPGAEIIIIRSNPETKRREYDLLKWGFVPGWAPDQASPHLHARAETVAELPTFRDAFAERRCVFNTNMFTQRRTIGQPKGREFAFGMADEADMLIAGIWDSWRIPGTDEWLRTFAVITTEANDLVGEIHDRMPVILNRDQLPVWFGEEWMPPEQLQTMLGPISSKGMIRWPAKSRRPTDVVQEEGPPVQPDLFSPRT